MSLIVAVCTVLVVCALLPCKVQCMPPPSLRLELELQQALGSFYRLFTAAYWRYLTGPCEVLSVRLSEDIASGHLSSYCPHLKQCPNIVNSQPCCVRETLHAIRQACCKTSSHPTSPPQCSYGTVFPSARVVGGQKAFRGEFPWIAMLLIDGRFVCGCTILDSTHALTAAHCFDRLENNPPNVEIIAGRYQYNLSKVEEDNQRIKVDRFIAHEQYDIKNMANDIAILILSRPLRFSTNVTPACLPSKGDGLKEKCTVAGFGYVGRLQPTDVMMKVELNTYNISQCLETFSQTSRPVGALTTFLPPGTLCAANGLLGGEDSCLGDSGGPLMCMKASSNTLRFYLSGIVSNGGDCGKPGEPGIYTDVSYFLDWIDSKLELR